MLQARDSQIISLLLEHNQGLSGNELAKLIGVSERTIRRDIKYIQANMELNGCILHSSVKNGYSLEVLDEKKFGVIRKQLDQKNESEQIIFYMLEQLILNSLHDTCISQMELSEKLYISLSTLKSHLKDVEKYLYKYQLKIVNYKNRGMKICGNEQQIRYAISEYISTKYKDGLQQYYQTIFTHIDIAGMKHIVMQALDHNMLGLTDLSIDNLLIHIAILIKRAGAGQLIHYEEEQLKQIASTKEFQVAQYIVREINRHFEVHIDLNETCYLAQHIITSKKYFELETVQLDMNLEQLVQKIMNTVNKICGINFSQDETLIHWLSLHLDIAIKRLQNHMNIRNEALDVIKKEYPLAFQIAAIAAKVIEQERNIKVNENEIGYIAIHFGAGLSRRGDAHYVAAKKAVLVCGTGIGTSVLVKARIQEYFKDRIQVIDTIPGYKLTEAVINSVDLVLTTIPFPQIKSDKIINLKSLLNMDEIALIEKKVLDREAFHNDLILELFRKEFFYPQMDFTNKWDVLEFMTDQMVQKGMMNEIGKASVKEREQLCSTELSNLLAIPHSLHNDLNKTIIPVLILKEPIIWNEKRVQIVLLINVAKEFFEVWDIFFPKLVKFLVKENGVQAILKDPSYYHFTKKLAEKFMV